MLVDEDEFGIGALPQEIVRQALLAAGADQQIGIGNADGVEVAADQFRRDRCGIEPARLHRLRDIARGPGDLLAAAIVEGDDEGQAGIVAGSASRCARGAR